MSDSRRPTLEPADTPNLKRRIARNLRRLRRERELTGLELARASGIAPSYIVKIERHGANLTIDVLERLAAALGVSVSALESPPPQAPSPAPAVARRECQPLGASPASAPLGGVPRA